MTMHINDRLHAAIARVEENWLSAADDRVVVSEDDVDLLLAAAKLLCEIGGLVGEKLRKE
jgi:hypothetical protein